MPVPIVGLALVGVRQDLVRLLDLLELLLGLRVTGIAVRMVLHRKLAISLLELFLRRVLRDAENLVKITFRHCPDAPLMPLKKRSPRANAGSAPFKRQANRPATDQPAAGA
jgi:hypothetical protein